jgi:enoyl-CoA hydratase
MTMDYSHYRRIAVARQGRLLRLTLNRPEVLNAVDEPMQKELAQIFYDVNLDDECDVVVIQGAGKAFSAGGDIHWLGESSSKGTPPSTVDGKRVVFGLLDCEKPIVAKLRGSCVGLGATVALLCDIIVAAEGTKIGDPHVKVGIVAGDGGAVIWPQLIGFAKAKEFLMTGDLVEAREAERIGLINHCVPEAELDAKVDALAEKLLNGATQAIRYTKVAVNIQLKAIATAVMDASVAYETMTFFTNDHHEAVKAFQEKRKPRFTGR